MNGSNFGFTRAVNANHTPVIPGTDYPRAEACRDAGKCQNLMRDKTGPNHRCSACRAAYKLASSKRRWQTVLRQRRAS